MWTPTKEELAKIIENHQHWVNADCDGWEAMRANLYEANLYGANLYGANLYGANLYGANLYGVNLNRANLCEANLYGANLYGANLREANLNRVDLCGANLYEANLYGANLCGANLCGAILYGVNLNRADLCEANLNRVDLCGADLCGADLNRVDLCGADLCGADLYGAKNIPFIPMACPDSGAFIGWKKARSSKGEHPDWCIIRLEIPSDARRSSATGRKCRCDKAVVLTIESLDGTTIYDHAYSDHDPDFEYKVGEAVSVDNFDEDCFNECSTGIHFFINRQEAVDYMF